MQRCGKAAICCASSSATASAIVDHAVGQAHGQCLVGADGAAGEDHVQRPALAHDPRQPTVPPSISGTPQRRQNTPNTARARGHAQVAHQGQLQAAGHRVAFDRGDHRLAEVDPGRPHGPGAVACGVDPVAPRRVAHGLQVGAGAEMATTAVQHRHAQVVIGLEGLEGRAQRVRGRPVDGVSAMRAVQRDGEHGTVACHRHGVVVCWRHHLGSSGCDGITDCDMLAPSRPPTPPRCS
jgi:hypothetical protein